MFLNENLIEIGLTGSSSDEVLRHLAERFVLEGVAKESFPSAVIERERVYPTGLPAVAFDIAIPHCASEYVIETSMAVATLASDVTFRQMGSPEITLHPKVLFMLAIKDPKKQIETLQALMGVIQDEGLLGSIREATTPKEVVSLMSDALGE